MKIYKLWLFNKLVNSLPWGRHLRLGLIIMLLGVIILSLKIFFADRVDVPG